MVFFEKHTYLWHILAWLIFMLLPFLISPMADNLGDEAFRLYSITKFVSYGFLIAFFYLNLTVLLPYLLKKRNWVVFIGVILLFLIVILRVEIAFFHIFMQHSRSSMVFERPTPPPTLGVMGFPIGRLLGSILSFILVLGVSSIMAFWRDRQKEKEAKQQMEFEKLAAELAVLKLQISPHFLFNTLNNIRWLARQKSDRTEDAVLKLSELLRYIIYQVNNEKVPLEQEINHLTNFIALQKMRLTNPDCVRFTCEGAIQGRMIEPLLFIPFVENAFKYGFHSQKPSDIVFKMQISEEVLIFESQNTIFTDNLPNETDDSGIGITNVQKRLNLYYPNRHELRLDTIEEQNLDKGGKVEVFYVYLKLKI